MATMRSFLDLLLHLVLLPALVCGVDLPTPVNEEVLGLVVFKAALQDPTAALASWNEADATPCNWDHVRCDPATSRVVRLVLDSLSLSGPLPRGLDRLPELAALSLANNNLSGPIPSGLSLLPALRSLDLSRNSFSGALPDDIALLPSLVALDLSSNAISGPLPESLFSAATCRSLRFLSLAGNRLEGPLPASLSRCSLLLHLNLSDNKLSGSPDFKSGLWSLFRLRVLDLSHNAFGGAVPNGVEYLHTLKKLRLNGNRFSGTIPAGVGLCLHLNSLDLSYNLFEGALPSSMRYLKSLNSLSLSNNQLSSEIPTWIGNLTAIQHMDLSNNKLTGILPASLGGLKELNYLSLSKNQLTGSIPDTIAGCTKLTELHLKKNQLNGCIPQGLFNIGLKVLDLSSNELTGAMPAGSTWISETLQSVDLSDNKLTGTIPPEMALFFGLRYLNLSWNNLRTQLPPELGLFRNLSVLDLRSSALYGPIPGDLCESGSLYLLQLDDNSLTGPIPEEIANCSSLYLLSLSHNNLNGSIPASMSQLRKLEILNLELNNLSGEIPQQLGTMDNLLAVNISHNQLIGRLPIGGVFQSLDQSALQGNLGLCTPLVMEPCKMNVPKPLVLDPDAYIPGISSSAPAMTNPAMPTRRRRFLSVSSIIAISAALIIILGVLVVTLLNVSTRRRIGLLKNGLESMCSSSTRSAGPAVGRMVLFDPKSSLRTEELEDEAEDLLSKATELGKGVFGTAYRTAVAGEGRILVIKKLSTANIVQYHEDFDREVRILGKVAHPNLMQLRGYYWTPQLQLLITDYTPHGSLHSRLHDRAESVPPLSWPDRFKIAIGTAKGLVHLHQAFRPSIIHYNLKPSNILLDEDCQPKISDFGLAKLLQKLDKHVISSRFQSAMGYMAPELACQSLRVNEKCDVYGYGVLMLELVTGKKPVEYGEDDVLILIDHVRVMLEQGNVLDCVDASMGEFPEEEVLPVLKLGLVCASQIPSSRPSMAEVVQILQVIKAPL
ncbi:putative inactive leucine-rich repeat receptor-like protein kinase [Canna indica]|uniref:Inactive leucine-rich repeat receptor-like protein kinase n=1 Tax=Canna indica TaxID=4628 RepID=A0AAQ3KLW0_9LILI|nr:putative inactive leucine-rich repeat receptor-like protein kinase [Canna indica]